MPLTASEVVNAKSRAKPYKLADGNGLFLHVMPNGAMPNGAKYWRLKFRFAGKEKLLALGVFPAVSLKEARAKRATALALLQEGMDPSHERKATKRAAKLAAANSFEAVAREALAKHEGRVTRRTAFVSLRRLENYVFPRIGAMPIKDVTAPHILDTLRAIEKTGRTDLPHRTAQECVRVFRFAVVSGLCTHNPASDLARVLTPHKKNHYAAITAAELPEFLAKADVYHGSHLTRLALRLIALTAVRTVELIRAEWKEVDFTRKVWSIPASRMKMKRPHHVPLSRQTIAALEELRATSGDSRFLFPGVNPERCMSNNTILKALKLMGYKGRMTGHGFRTLARTTMGEETGFKVKVLELTLAHVERNAVIAAYDRGEYWDERGQAMQWWADRLDKARGMNIIPFAPSRAG